MSSPLRLVTPCASPMRGHDRAGRPVDTPRRDGHARRSPQPYQGRFGRVNLSELTGWMGLTRSTGGVRPGSENNRAGEGPWKSTDLLPPGASCAGAVYLIAIGLMMPWTAPVVRDGPRVKSDSHALSFTMSSVCMFSRM